MTPSNRALSQDIGQHTTDLALLRRQMSDIITVLEIVETRLNKLERHGEAVGKNVLTGLERLNAGEEILDQLEHRLHAGEKTVAEHTQLLDYGGNVIDKHSKHLFAGEIRLDHLEGAVADALSTPLKEEYSLSSDKVTEGTVEPTLNTLVFCSECGRRYADEGVNCYSDDNHPGWSYCYSDTTEKTDEPETKYAPLPLPDPSYYFSLHTEKTDEPEEPYYPHKDGEFTVLGPEIFTDNGDVLCWKGQNYIKCADPVVPEEPYYTTDMRPNTSVWPKNDIYGQMLQAWKKLQTSSSAWDSTKFQGFVAGWYAAQDGGHR